MVVMDAEEDCTSAVDPATDDSVSEEQKDRARRNKEKALELRKARNKAHPYNKPPVHKLVPQEKKAVPSLRDSYAGYFIEDEPSKSTPVYRVAEESVPALPDALMMCCECGKKFAESYLYTKFQLSTCDKCRDPDGKHALLTKTEAKQRYLLKDCDFGERNGPPLSFLLKKNPHTSGWGEMKLYLQCQVESRSHEIWGGEKGLAEERLNKMGRQEKRKEKKYAKEIKDLRRAVRSSLIQPTSSSHVHSYTPGEETHNPEDDSWTKTCSECGYQVTFEKM